ncbi:UDP-N-acetylglucosamine 2-epimerase [Paenibacillus sp. MSJ-34]|uniref:UDP-N-acetylglucosamine 2-epimerase n=1 Tax=Paenibacillus sp. MSJ-34 TaxID=2841529 RepID=UPI001C11CCA3|nr:UDP-N-acetylglucosamine 2-epimerase [Paenibacillus sp. MSJ-34]MBU5440997.1 CDP-glycerol glycerophosphotransferase family protein [Paenibacillus sp. MSJ-34]
MKKKVLVFTYLQRHLKKMIPIIKRLKEDSKISLVTLIMTSEEKAIALENEIDFVMLDEFSVVPRSMDLDFGWGLEPLINAIDTIKPDLFMAVEVNHILRNAVRYCFQMGVTTLVIQHGTPNKYSLHAFAPFEGDYFAAWGEHTKQFLVQHGVDPEKIFLTGGVNFDRTRNLCSSKEIISEKLGICSRKKWIVFTTQYVGAMNCPSLEEITIAFTEVAKLSKLYSDCHFIFQVHPGQSMEQVSSIIKTIEEPNCIIVRYYDTEELLSVCDGMITFFSTTALDCVILEKPLLLINLSEDREFLPFVQMGAAFGAYEKGEIASQLKRLIYEPDLLVANSEKAAKYINYLNDGRAIDRVIDLIYSSLN